MKLTTHMRAALTNATSHPLRRVHIPQPGKPPWPAPPVTLHALVKHGLLTYDRRRDRKGWRLDEWTITEAGRETLAPQSVTRRDIPIYLARSGAITYRTLPNGRWTVDTTSSGNGDYSTDPRRSIDQDHAPGSRTATAVEVLVRPEHVDQFAEHAHARQQERLREKGDELDAKSLTERVDRMRRVARDHHMDFSTEDRFIRYLIRHGRVKTAEDRLARAEAQLRQRAA